MSFRQITVTAKTGTRLTLGARLFDNDPFVEFSIYADDGSRATVLFEPHAAKQLGQLANLVSASAQEMAWDEMEEGDDA